MARRIAEEAAETRRSILGAAHRLFSEQGFAQTPLEEVAATAGVTRGALYHHFANKRELFRAVFIELESELDVYVNRTARKHSADARKAFLAGCRAFLRFTARRPDYQRIVLVEGAAVLGESKWHELDSQLGLASMERGVKALMRAGEIKTGPSRPIAVVLFGALNEAGFAIARGESVSVSALVSTIERVLDGLGSRP